MVFCLTGLTVFQRSVLAPEIAGSSASDGLAAAMPVTIAYTVVGGVAALVTSWFARRSVREVTGLSIEGTVRSALLGRNRDVLRLISRADRLDLVEQRGRSATLIPRTQRPFVCFEA